MSTQKIDQHTKIPYKRIKIKNIEQPQLNKDEFHALYHILWDCYKNNDAKCARIMGISRPTWIRWRSCPPKWPFYTEALRFYIKHAASLIEGSRGFSKVHRDRVLNALYRLPNNSKLAILKFVADETLLISGSVTHLRELLEQHPEGVHAEELTKSYFSGGYSMSQLYAASIIIGVIKRQEGFGKKKHSVWYAPIEDEEDNIQSV